MQLVGGLFLKLFAGAGAAAAEAGAISASLGTAVTTGASSGLSILQGLGTAVGIISQIGAGVAQSNELKAQAKQQEFEARQEYISGKETSAALKNELAKTIGNQRVLFASGGVDLGSVSVEVAKGQAVKDAESELAINSSESLSRSLARRRAARNLRSQASGAIGRGIMGGLQTGINYGLDLKDRGLNVQPV